MGLGIFSAKHSYYRHVCHGSFFFFFDPFKEIFISLPDRMRLTVHFNTLKQAIYVDKASGMLLLEIAVTIPPLIHKEKNKVNIKPFLLSFSFSIFSFEIVTPPPPYFLPQLDNSDTHSKEVWERTIDFTNGIIGLCYKNPLLLAQFSSPLLLPHRPPPLFFDGLKIPYCSHAKSSRMGWCASGFGEV